MAGFRVLILYSFIAIGLSYEIATLNKYSYETTVVLNEKCGLDTDPQMVGHSLKADVHLTAVWQHPQNPSKKLLKIEILNPKLSIPRKSSFEEHASELDKLSSSAAYVLWEDGVPKKIWDNPSEHYSLRNLKRGIISFLNIRKEDGRAREVDVSGECDVLYAVKGNYVQRRKGNCVHFKFDKTLSQPHGVRSSSVVHQSTSDCEWTERHRIVSSCNVIEYSKLYANAWHRPSLCVNSKSEFVFRGEEKGQSVLKDEEMESAIEKLKESHANALEESELSSILVMQEEAPKKSQLKAAISKSKDSLKTDNLAKLKSARAFYKLLPMFRAASSAEILQVLKNDKMEEIKPQILDLVSACANENCLKAAFAFFEAENEYSPTLERFVISLSILPRPNAPLLNQLKSFLEKEREERIQATLLATLGTLLKTYAENDAIADIQIVEKFRDYLEDGLKKCDSEICSLNHLRGIRNSGRPRSVPLLLQYAAKGGKLALEAILGIRNIPHRLLPPETEGSLLKLFNEVETRQDRSTKALVAELLLRQHPSTDVLKSILKALQNQEDSESSSYLASKLVHMMIHDQELRSSIQKVLPEKDISYYYSLAQSGQSSLFTRPMVSIEGTNVTYGLETELLTGGMLKRTVFDVSFENAAGSSSLLSVGIFASGLSAVAGGDSSSDSDESPTAGMELGFLGSSLRPYVFFRSTSELMSHAWSGTASTPTPVLQCTSAFSDDEKLIVLNNGMIVRSQLRGVLSSDSSASIQISLWNRNSQSLVQNKGALLVRGSVTVDTGFVVTQGAIMFTGESLIDFKTDLEFYETPYTTCMQMEHPEIKVNSDVRRSVSLPGTNYHLKRTKKRTMVIPGRSFAFNELNNKMCRVLKENY